MAYPQIASVAVMPLRRRMSEKSFVLGLSEYPSKTITAPGYLFDTCAIYLLQMSAKFSPFTQETQRKSGPPSSTYLIYWMGYYPDGSFFKTAGFDACASLGKPFASNNAEGMLYNSKMRTSDKSMSMPLAVKTAIEGQSNQVRHQFS